jgi:hypothetical protein
LKFTNKMPLPKLPQAYTNSSLIPGTKPWLQPQQHQNYQQSNDFLNSSLSINNDSYDETDSAFYLQAYMMMNRIAFLYILAQLNPITELNNNTSTPAIQQLYIQPEMQAEEIKPDISNNNSTQGSSNNQSINHVNSALVPAPFINNSLTRNVSRGKVASKAASKKRPRETEEITGEVKGEYFTPKQLEALDAYFLQNIEHPYMKLQQKVNLAADINTSVPRISNWLINQRQRKWRDQLIAHLAQKYQKDAKEVKAEADRIMNKKHKV